MTEIVSLADRRSEKRATNTDLARAVLTQDAANVQRAHPDKLRRLVASDPAGFVELADDLAAIAKVLGKMGDPDAPLFETAGDLINKAAGRNAAAVTLARSMKRPHAWVEDESPDRSMISVVHVAWEASGPALARWEGVLGKRAAKRYRRELDDLVFAWHKRVVAGIEERQK